MTAIDELRPAAVWNCFREICAIAHPSGHETALGEYLLLRSRGQGLRGRRDAAGNLRIDRPAAPGMETAPTVIMQGHLDMVPQAAPGVKFDFLRQGIPLRLDQGWVSSAAGTTLGADDGMGVAMAMAMLEDSGLRCGPLAAVFTVGEETGLIGARNLDPAFLDGDYLLNLDNESETFCIGCAGGCRQEFELSVPRTAPPEEGESLRIELGGLAGGHSGIQIHERRGNALIYLARLLLECGPGLRIAAFSGGGADNVIPAAAAATVVMADAAALRARLPEFRDRLCGELDVQEGFTVTATSVRHPDSVWSCGFQTAFLDALTAVPNGVVEWNPESGVVRTSSNLAAVLERGGRLIIRTSQRSSDDAARDALAQRVARSFAVLQPAVRMDGVYPGWLPEPGGRLLAAAAGVYEELFGVRQRGEVIHAGLETGLFKFTNPRLELLSFGAETVDLHTPAERVSVESVERISRFLHRLLEVLAAPVDPVRA